ncbi:MAG: AtpZ/AtpI family protein [Deltaproteobacteria bacterium]|nr:AtpZ/AtpI family protein [Deltaproteobacteria bacterium]
MLASPNDEDGRNSDSHVNESKAQYKGLQYIALGTEIAFTVAGSAWLGWWLDKRFGSGPWLLLSLLLLGGASSMFMLFKLASKLSKEDDG